MAGVRMRKSKEEEDGLIEQYGGQHISKYGGSGLASYGGPDIGKYGGPPIGSYGKPKTAPKKGEEVPGAQQGFRDLFQMAKGLRKLVSAFGSKGAAPSPHNADEFTGVLPDSQNVTAVAPKRSAEYKTPSLESYAGGASPYPREAASLRSPTTNPQVQREQNGSLVKIVEDTPQAPPPVTPPPIDRPLDPAAQESFNNKLAYQEKYNADPANADKTKLGYQPVPGPAGMSILRKGVGQGAEDVDTTPLADRAPFESIRGTTGTYSNQAAPLTEYATKAEAENQERADVTNLRETQERKLASEASIQEMKNKGLFDVSVQSGKNDVATQMEYNKRPKTSAEKKEDFAKATKNYIEAADEVNPNPVMGARILLDLEARGADGVAAAKLLMNEGTPEYKLEVIRLVREYKKRKIELKNK